MTPRLTTPAGLGAGKAPLVVKMRPGPAGSQTAGGGEGVAPRTDTVASTGAGPTPPLPAPVATDDLDWGDPGRQKDAPSRHKVRWRAGGGKCAACETN